MICKRCGVEHPSVHLVNVIDKATGNTIKENHLLCGCCIELINNYSSSKCLEMGDLKESKGQCCKRYTVTAMGIQDTEMAVAKNYNEGECTGEVGNCGCIHAEISLLKKLPNPDTVIVSTSPCLECAKALLDAGVKTVIFKEYYRLPDGAKHLVENGVKVYRLISDTGVLSRVYTEGGID